MILSYLLTKSIDWRQANVHIKMVVEDENAVEKATENVKKLLQEIRIKAIPDVIAANGRSFDSILATSSVKADLVFLGMAKPDENFPDYYCKMQERVKDLPTTILALAGQEVSFGEVLINQGE
jgi:hypothetical protein